MKLNAKQQEIKDRVLGEERAVLRNDVGKEKAIEILNSIEDWDWNGHYEFYGSQHSDCFIAILEEEVKDRPMINMSEWFKENFNGNREYDDIIRELVDKKAEQDNQIDLNAYESGMRALVIKEKEDFQGNREYDEKLLFNLKVYLQDECYIKPSFIYNFLDKRYPNELLKEKEELEARLKEINEKLNG